MYYVYSEKHNAHDLFSAFPGCDTAFPHVGATARMLSVTRGLAAVHNVSAVRSLKFLGFIPSLRCRSCVRRCSMRRHCYPSCRNLSGPHCGVFVLLVVT